MKNIIFGLAAFFISVNAMAQNVGIGTQEPRAGLEIRMNSVLGSPNGAHLLLMEDDNDFARIRFINNQFNSETNNRYWDIAARIDSDANGINSFLNFYRNGFGDVLSLRGNGYVGIGTNPVVPLHVQSAISHTALFNGPDKMYLSLFEQNTYRGYLGSFSGNAADVDFGTGAGNTAGKLHLTIQTTPKLTVRENGFVGINNTNPQWQLDVEGGIRFDGRLFVNGTSGSMDQILTSQSLGVPIWSDRGLSKVAAKAVFTDQYYTLNPASGNGNLIIFDNEEFDDNNRYNTTNGRYTAPAAGLYQITVSVDWQDLLGASEFMFFNILKNGSTKINGFTGRGTIPTVNFTFYAKLNSGEYISLYGGHTSASTRRLRREDSFMTVVRLY